MCKKVDPCYEIYIVNVKRFWTSRDGTRTHVEYLRHTQVPEKVEFLFKFRIFKCQVKILNEDFEIRFLGNNLYPLGEKKQGSGLLGRLTQVNVYNA